MNTPATPTATAARASTGTNSRWPPDEVPFPPGCCTEWVASKITGAPVVCAMIGSARQSDAALRRSAAAVGLVERGLVDEADLEAACDLFQGAGHFKRMRTALELARACND